MKIEAFSKTYDGVTVVDFPGASLNSGEIVAIIGANGCGKSTFAKIVAGVLPSDQRKKPLAVSSVGYMPQKNFAFRMTTRKNILLANNDPVRADVLMKTINLQHLADKQAHKLSGGETARMALARLMMKEYALVLLDEPTAAMDMESTLLAEQLIMHYVKQTRCALVLVTHSLQQAKRIADRIMFFKAGQLVEEGPKDTLLQTPSTPVLKQFLDFYGL